ncbi:MAG: hypothetical protein ACJA2D_000339 [Pseudohongiellaceae bacterium]|jgi:hypothetical protein
MTNSPFDRAALSQAVMQFVPPLIRQTLLDETAFNEELGLKKKTMVSFGESGVPIQRAALFDAIRSVLAGTKNAEVIDEAGNAWQLRNEVDDEALPALTLSADGERLILPDVATLSDDVGIRIRSFEQAAVDVNLPIDVKEHWRKILEERALEDGEIDILYRDLRNTPVHLERIIRSEINEGKSSISSLVPSSREYYSRLVGSYDGSASIQEYAASVGQPFLNSLSKWQPYEGFLFSLLLASHSSLTSEIQVGRLNNDDLLKAFEFIEANGDMLSLLGAFEIGLRILPQRPELDPLLVRLVHRIRDDNLESEQCEFKLFSSLFVLVDGELSRTRLLSETPPFYRRMASLAHAALIHRVIIQGGIEYKSFYEWAFNSRFEDYYMQSLADMRTEPRWNPDLIDPSQIKEDFFGRLMIAGNIFSEHFGESELRETILGNNEKSLAKLSSFFRPYYPGPLEGRDDSPNQLPKELAYSIDEQLNTDTVDASSFIALVNSAMIFKISAGHAELAAKALRLGNYTLSKLENKSQLVSILNGLATVAAASRSPTLADELRILVRRYLRDPQYKFSIEEGMRVCLV